MRKLFLLLSYVVVFVLLISACGNKQDSAPNAEDTAKDFGKKFIKTLYDVDDPDIYQRNFTSTDDAEEIADAIKDYQGEFSLYLTEDELEFLTNSRFLFMPLEAAGNLNNTINVQNITFDKYDADQAEGDAFKFEHSFALVFKDEEGNEVNEVTIEGQMTIIDTDNGLKIDRYYDGGIPMEIIKP